MPTNKNWRASTRAFFRRFGRRTLTQLLPTILLDKVATLVEEPDHYPKLPFNKFVHFMVAAILWRNKRPSTRRLAGLSRNPILQHVTKVEPVSHMAIANRLRSISLEGLRTLLRYVKDSSRYFLSKTLKGYDLLKFADCTTVERSKLFVPWAADNGDQQAVRLAITVDGQSDTPELAYDASTTTSDNTIFPELVNGIRRGETLVLDAGFTKLSEFQRLQEAGAYWIANMANIYKVDVIHRYQLPSAQSRRYKHWYLLQDERVTVGTSRHGGPIVARCCHWRDTRTNEVRVVWTNRFTWTPKRIFRADRDRWRIEVQFRWLKSELGLDHLPSYDRHGVMAFFLLVLLAWLVLRLFSARQTGQPWPVFSCRDALTSFQNTLIGAVITHFHPSLAAS